MIKEDLKRTVTHYTSTMARLLTNDNLDSTYLGELGEDLTEHKLNLLKLFGNDGYIIRNVYIPKDNGETTEIDVIFVTKRGIFVIESKNYSGWIYGDDKGAYWTAVLSKNQKQRFYSPLKQNEMHIKWLKEYLKAENMMFLSLIVFSERCELKVNVSEDLKKTAVIKRDELFFEIKKVWPKLTDSISDAELFELKNKLEALTQVSQDTKELHIDTINSKFSDEATICPWCNGKLVKRTVRKGPNAGKEFTGCENFPKCRYTKK